MADTQYDEFIRIRITELRIAKNISEHKMSLDLDKSGSYIRGITSGAALPSLRELFNIISYFDMTPAEFLKYCLVEKAAGRIKNHGPLCLHLLNLIFSVCLILSQ